MGDSEKKGWTKIYGVCDFDAAREGETVGPSPSSSSLPIWISPSLGAWTLGGHAERMNSHERMKKGE